MDLFAYTLQGIPEVSVYIDKYYGEVPRPRGVRFMKLEKPESFDDDTYHGDLFRRHCGMDVVYIHTRCGSFYNDDDERSNYVSCGGKAWEKAHADTFIESIDDDFDGTYRDHYFNTVPGPEYDAAIAAVLNVLEVGVHEA